MQENHEGGIPDYLPERAVLRLQLPALYSAVVYCGRQRGRGDNPVCAVDDALLTGVAGDFRDCRGDYCDVEIVSRHLFWGD